MVAGRSKKERGLPLQRDPLNSSDLERYLRQRLPPGSSSHAADSLSKRSPSPTGVLGKDKMTQRDPGFLWCSWKIHAETLKNPSDAILESGATRQLFPGKNFRFMP